MLERVVQRARLAALADETIVVTSVNPQDQAVVEECQRIDVPVFRGAEDDVLDRFYRAVEQYRPAVIVRITADCPLLDPVVMNDVIRRFLAGSPDYASNTLQRTYPRGLDTEVVSAGALARAWQNALEPYQRAHVTPYIVENRADFRLLSVCGEVDLSAHRWVVDVPEDLEFVRAIYERLGSRDDFVWTDVLELLAEEPSLSAINDAVNQKPLWEG